MQHTQRAAPVDMEKYPIPERNDQESKAGADEKRSQHG
jgi:hypothetical protein